MKKRMICFVTGLGLVAVIAMGVVTLVATPSAEAGRQACGGFAGLECPNPNQICVDDPRDNCDPKTGGRDCIGVCRGPGRGR